MKMKRTGVVLCSALPAVLAVAGFCFVGQRATANSNPYGGVAVQEQVQQPSAEKPASDAQTFSGRIVNLRDQLVLSGQEGKMTYKLDDQEKAKEFVNKDVKVTGVLDESTGVIRVSEIGPSRCKRCSSARGTACAPRPLF